MRLMQRGKTVLTLLAASACGPGLGAVELQIFADEVEGTRSLSARLETYGCLELPGLRAWLGDEEFDVAKGRDPFLSGLPHSGCQVPSIWGRLGSKLTGTTLRLEDGSDVVLVEIPGLWTEREFEWSLPPPRVARSHSQVPLIYRGPPADELRLRSTFGSTGAACQYVELGLEISAALGTGVLSIPDLSGPPAPEFLACELDESKSWDDVLQHATIGVFGEVRPQVARCDGVGSCTVTRPFSQGWEVSVAP